MKNAKKYFAIQQLERSADIYIFGDIVPFAWYESDVTAVSIVKQIQNLDVDEIRVHIDSYGGSVSEGWAICNALRHHPAKVTTYGDGFVASAALYPFLAGDERYASNLSAYYFHQVSVSANGYADDLRAAANEAETMTEIGIQAFVDYAGMDAQEVKDLMEAETWLSPSEALEKGLATAILADESVGFAQDAKRQILQRVLRIDRKPEKQAVPLQEPHAPPHQAEPKKELSLTEKLANMI